MRLLHTSDWHLGIRLAGLPRLDDQLAQVERVLALCDDHRVDVLIVAGDVFHVDAPDRLRPIVDHLADMLEPRLANGLSILFLPGNHDRDHLFPILEWVQRLAGRVEPHVARVCSENPHAGLHRHHAG